MGAVAALVKSVISIGGTGQPYITPHRNDVVYNLDLNDRGKGVTFDRAMQFIPFFAAVRNISEDVAGLPLNVYRKTAEGRLRDTEHPVDSLLGLAPNPYMSAFSFRETLQSHVLTWGNGYAEIEFDTEGRPFALWPLRPDQMEVLVDRSKGEVFYRYTLSDGHRVDLNRRNVFHVHGLGYDGLTGYSIIEKARRTLSMTLASEKYGEQWYEKGGLPKAVLIHPNTLSQPARDNLRTSVEANYGTLEGRQRIMLLEEGMSLETLGVPAKDAAFLDTMTNAKHLMATLFRMPPDMLQDVERSTSWGTGIEQQGIGYVKYTLRGHLGRWEQEGKMRLLPGDDRYLRHVVDGLLRGDTTARWTGYRQGLDLGVYSIDDVLEMEDRNPLADGHGKLHYVQLNRAPIEQVGEMSMEQRIAAVGGLVRAGFTPEAATDLVELPTLEHTGLEPVTVQPPPKPELRVVKMAEFRCPEHGTLINRSAAPGTVGFCGKCKAERVFDEEILDPFKSLNDRLDDLGHSLAAMSTRPEPPAPIVFPEGFGKVDVHLPPSQTTVHIPEPRPVRKVIQRDADGRIVGSTEEPV